MTTTPFPRLPDPPADPGEYLTHFDCILGQATLGAKGELKLPIVVAPEDKYLAMPLTDVRGKQFRVIVYVEKGRVPLVNDGTLVMYTAQERVKKRRQDRRWREARREWFEGSRT